MIYKLNSQDSIKWINCPASARVESQINGLKDNAEDNIELLAKQIVEVKLNHYYKKINADKLEQASREVLDSDLYTKELEESLDNIVTMVINTISFDKKSGNTSILLLNDEVDNSLWIPNGKTIVPIAIITKNSLEIIGYNITVSEEEVGSKFQELELQALGVINEYICMFDVESVNFTYIDIKGPNIHFKSTQIEDLLDRADHVIRPAANNASLGLGDATIGSHCYLCSGQHLCKRNNQAVSSLMAYDTTDPLILSEEEILTILSYGDKFKKWIDEVNKYALDQSVNFNKRWENFKLVEGRRTRKYKDEAAVKEKLIAAGYNEGQIVSSSLLSLSAMEKVVGKDRLKEILGELIVKPKGKATLVHFSDKRAELRVVTN